METSTYQAKNTGPAAVREATNTSSASAAISVEGDSGRQKRLKDRYCRFEGLADVVATALEPVADRIELAFIFGSVARGAETEGSDIDVSIIGSADFGAVIDSLHPAQAQLAREINPKLFSTHEWKMKLRVPDPFVRTSCQRRRFF